MNELQKKEFELLKYFVDICNRLGLKYYLVCGSALGAVKYGGFIPWDDDMDVALLREDYNIFLEEAQKLLPKDVFLQNYKTDPQYPQLYSKLRDSNTTYIEKSSAHLDINHGVYLDIFPLDGYPTNKFSKKCFEIKKTIYKLELLSAFNLKCGLIADLIRSVFCALGINKRTAKILKKYEKMIAKYPTSTSNIWCNHGNWQGRIEYASREQYGEGIEMDFEGMAVRIPENYDAYLTQKYGDWRADLPPEKRVGHHFYEILDFEHSYTDYIKKVSSDGREIWLKKY